MRDGESVALDLSARQGCLGGVLPCHRVVPTSGGTGAYAFGRELKRELLQREGVAVEKLDSLQRQEVRYVGWAQDGLLLLSGV